MICVADSGSTKTTWLVIDKNQKEVFRKSSIGLNPFFVGSKEVAEVVKTVFRSFDTSHIQKIFFYGAGCSSTQRNAIISNGILTQMPDATVEVDHDLLAAARATCKYKAGVACILGTGANTCQYDGMRITDNIPALGFMIGDEGSGTAIGRRLLQGWLYREMPHDLVKSFVQGFEISKDKMLTDLYSSLKPNKYLAQFSTFCSKHRTHPYIQNLLKNNFQEFVERHIAKYEQPIDGRINFVGSIAFYFGRELERALNDFGFTLGVVLQNPIDELAKYHLLK